MNFTPALLLPPHQVDEGAPKGSVSTQIQDRIGDNMKRIVGIAAGFAAGVAVAGTVIAVHAGPAYDTGVGAGTSTYTNNVAACTSVGGGGGLCTVKLKGDYFDATLLGDGTYSGTVTIDFSTYAYNSTVNESCAYMSGTITYSRNSSTMKTSLPSGGSNLACDNGSGLRDLFIGGQVTSVNGVWKHVNPSASTVSWNDRSSPSLPVGGSASLYFDNPIDVGNTLLVIG